MKKKRITIAILVLALSLCLFACGEKPQESDDVQDNEETVEETVDETSVHGVPNLVLQYAGFDYGMGDEWGEYNYYEYSELKEYMSDIDALISMGLEGDYQGMASKLQDKSIIQKFIDNDVAFDYIGEGTSNPNVEFWTVTDEGNMILFDYYVSHGTGDNDNYILAYREKDGRGFSFKTSPEEEANQKNIQFVSCGTAGYLLEGDGMAVKYHYDEYQGAFETTYETKGKASGEFFEGEIVQTLVMSDGREKKATTTFEAGLAKDQYTTDEDEPADTMIEYIAGYNGRDGESNGDIEYRDRFYPDLPVGFGVSIM